MNQQRKKASSEDFLEGAELILSLVVATIFAFSIAGGVYALVNQFGTTIAIIAALVSSIPGFVIGWFIYKARWLIRSFFDH